LYSITDFNSIGVNAVGYAVSVDSLKKALIEKGPLTFESNFFQVLNDDENINSHAMLLVGYETDAQGRTVLIFKNSWGTTWGTNGFAKTYVPNRNSGVYYIIHPLIKNSSSSLAVNCVDDDNDSYCNWGIGSRPATCPAKCSSNPQDCDDSNPGLRGFDVNYNCVNVSSGRIVFDSTPSDANVYVGGVLKGKTPLTLDINAGAYTFIVKKENYSPQSIPLSVMFLGTTCIQEF
jgi:hypothetical protein